MSRRIRLLSGSAWLYSRGMPIIIGGDLFVVSKVVDHSTVRVLTPREWFWRQVGHAVLLGAFIVTVAYVIGALGAYWRFAQ